MYPSMTGLLVLASTSLLAGCATLLTPRTPPLTLRTHPDSVTVRLADGRVLGTAPITDLRLRPGQSLTLQLDREGWQPARVPARRRPRGSFALNAFLPGVLAMVALEAGADPGDVVLLALAVPVGALVDYGTGAVWEHDPRVLEVTLAPLPPATSPTSAASAASATSATSAASAGGLSDLPLDPPRATVAATLLLRAMAQAADDAGCAPAVSELARRGAGRGFVLSGYAQPGEAPATLGRDRAFWVRQESGANLQRRLVPVNAGCSDVPGEARWVHYVLSTERPGTGPASMSSRPAATCRRQGP